MLKGKLPDGRHLHPDGHHLQQILNPNDDVIATLGCVSKPSALLRTLSSAPLDTNVIGEDSYPQAFSLHSRVCGRGGCCV